MLYAKLNQQSQRLYEPFKGGKGFCPTCNAEVLAKCGTVNVHHWAHLNLKDCDQWKEPEGPWHRNWKLRFPAAYREVVKDHHRADVKLNNLVIEFQHSPISSREVLQREEFWQDLVWVLDVRDKNTIEDQGNRLKWCNSYKWILRSKAVLILDTQFGLYLVKGKYKPHNKPLFLYGKFITFGWLEYVLKNGHNLPDFT